MTKLSVAIASYNEANNIATCLSSIKNICDEVVIVDGLSNDDTAKIAKSFGAKVISVPNDPMFHKMKQRSFEEAKGEWILYLDADERVTKRLANEIVKVINMSNQEIEEYQQKLSNKRLFERHQKLLEERDGLVGNDDMDYSAFFFPRLNFFLGKYLRYGGVYPDGVIRLFKKNRAYLPCVSVHEQLVVNGKVGWLQNDLLHIDSPTFKRYLERNSRYIDLIVQELKRDKVKKNIGQFLNYMLLKPLWWLILTQIRHKGILDGYQGFIFSFFSALRFPRAYYRYLKP